METLNKLLSLGSQEKKGYDVNNAELRPRVVAATGVIGAKLGHISQAKFQD